MACTSALVAIDHIQVCDLAAMAEVFREEDGAEAADRRFRHQRIKPAELFMVGQLVGIQHQVGVGRHHLEAIERSRDPWSTHGAGATC